MILNIDMERLLNNILQGNWGSPQEVFEQSLKFSKTVDSLYFRAVNIFCWNTIAKTILELKSILPHYNNGITLCDLMIVRSKDISETDLELGIECIKFMSDIIIDKNDNLSREEKEHRKLWLKTLLDIWKEFVKEELRKEKELKNIL